MGMDVMGIDPIVRGKKPEIDWDTADHAEKDFYFEQMHAWEKDNPGYYFRANVWSWRPIHALIQIASNNFSLDIDTAGFGYNDGSGIRNQRTCDKLADALEVLIENHTHLKEDDDMLYLNLGMWTTSEGFSLRDDLKTEAEKAMEAGAIVYTPIVLSDGTLATPSHGVSKWHLEKFISFLRECGGFEIF
jgi:hypothetical protein